MKTLIDQLSQYAAYHRDRRNIATHFVGVPMIVVAVATLLARPVLADVGGVAISPATIAVIVTALYYLRLDLRFGAVMAVLLALCLWFAQVFGAGATSVWLTAGVGLFVVGWIIQFIGHYYEGRKPAFADDIMGLIIGPLFVVAEMGFLIGMRPEVQHAIEERSGPVKSGRVAGAA